MFVGCDPYLGGLGWWDVTGVLLAQHLSYITAINETLFAKSHESTLGEF